MIFENNEKIIKKKVTLLDDSVEDVIIKIVKNPNNSVTVFEN